MSRSLGHVFPKQLVLSIALGGCAQVVGLEPPSSGDTIIVNGGSTERAPSESKPLPPPQQECAADVLHDANNCGFCGRSCGGAACENGLCRPDIVTRGSIGAFATDGVDLFYASSNAVRGCSAAGPADQTCRSVIRSEDVRKKLAEGGSRWRFEGPTPPLRPLAVTVFGDRVHVTDDMYRSVISCPKTGVCDASTMGVLYAIDERESASGASIAADGTGAFFPIGSGLAFGNAIGRSEAVVVEAAQTTGIRKLALSKDELFWLSPSGVHSLKTPVRAGTTIASWSTNAANDIAVDDGAIYLATNTDAHRIDRATRKTELLVAGSFRTIAVSDGAVYASWDDTLVQIFAGIAHTIAEAHDTIRAINVTKEHVYWATSSEIGRVVR